MCAGVRFSQPPEVGAGYSDAVMVNFRLGPGPSAEKQTIERELRAIQRKTSNLAQLALFEKRAIKLFDKNHRPSRGARFQRILKVAEEAHTAIDDITPLEGINDPQIMEHHKDVCKILQEAAAKLNAEMTRSPERIEEDKFKEEEAIKSDLNGVEDAILQLQASRARSTTADIQVYRMESPLENAIPVPKFKCYKEIVWYLRDKGFVSRPELWRRLDVPQGPTKNGYKWEFAGGAQPIDSPVVHVVNMTHLQSENYIVALVHDHVNNVEIPVPLDVIHIWDTEDEAKWCCKPFCGNLRTHLKFHWPDRLIIKATRLEEPFTSVISTAFDTSEFPPRTNNLYLQWEPKTPV